MPFERIQVTPFEQMCTLLQCGDTAEAVVIDPGGDVGRILQRVAAQGARVRQVWLTHGHIDHVGGAEELSRELGVPISGPAEADRPWLEGLPDQSRMFGFRPVATFQPERWFVAGEELRVGNLTVEVRHTPGHTPGHVVFVVPQERIVIVGDVLFAGSIGRTDFPMGSHRELLRSIQTQLLTLDDEVEVLPGHGPTTTIGRERRQNPFIGRADALIV